MSHDPWAAPSPRRPAGPFARLAARLLIRSGLFLHAAATRAARALVRQRPAGNSPVDVLLTGTFHSDAWIAAHLGPLVASRACKRVRMVATSPVPPLPNVEPVYPPPWLRRAIGAVPARLAVFAWTAVRTRPDVVGGFHLLVNALVAQVVAAAVGARSLYFCVGGPTELIDGGVHGENAYFARLGAPDAAVERRLLAAATRFDLIVTMGSRAAEYFRRHGARRVHLISGGIDLARFRPGGGRRDFDLVFVGRLVPIKQVDRVLFALARVRERIPGATAVLVGAGPLRPSLEELARRLKLDESVTFAGHQARVEPWLQRGKIFILTSASEGLALSLMEAMACGLPAVVPNVGDLADLVEDGVNGYVVDDASADALAGRIGSLLVRPDRLAAFSASAVRSARRFDPAAVSLLWDEALAPSREHVTAARTRASAGTGV